MLIIHFKLQFFCCLPVCICLLLLFSFFRKPSIDSCRCLAAWHDEQLLNWLRVFPSMNADWLPEKSRALKVSIWTENGTKNQRAKWRWGTCVNGISQCDLGKHNRCRQLMFKKYMSQPVWVNGAINLSHLTLVVNKYRNVIFRHVSSSQAVSTAIIINQNLNAAWESM